LRIEEGVWKNTGIQGLGALDDSADPRSCDKEVQARGRDARGPLR
jgi:hypothetical protein